jgi:hypothetical protein
MPFSDSGLCRAFRAILLLTGSAAHAEDAVLSAIQSTEPEEASDQRLLLGAVEAALEREGHANSGCVPPALCPELGRVLRLMPARRHCFVLRILIGFSREVCSRLLHLNVEEIDEITCTAARELALSS